MSEGSTRDEHPVVNQLREIAKTAEHPGVFRALIETLRLTDYATEHERLIEPDWLAAVVVSNLVDDDPMDPLVFSFRDGSVQHLPREVTR